MLRPRPAAVAALVVCAVGAPGCGDHEPAARAPKVELLLARNTARSLLSENGPPGAAEVERLAQRIRGTCNQVGASDYDCTLDYGGPAKPHCAVRTDSRVTRILSMRCGLRTAPRTRAEHVDCRVVGRLVSRADPRGDVKVPQVDLRAVRLAANSKRICVEWETAAPLQPPYELDLWLYSPRAPGNLQLTVVARRGEQPDIQGPDYSISGSFGIRGTSASLLVQADDLPQAFRQALDGPFEFEARAGRPIGRGRARKAVGDYLNFRKGRPRYP